MNILARYVTGYLGDIGVPVPPYAMDFSAWFEVFSASAGILSNLAISPRIGRILIPVGRDTADVAITTNFAGDCAENSSSSEMSCPPMQLNGGIRQRLYH